MSRGSRLACLSAGRFVTMSALVLLSGCISNPAPPRWLPTPLQGPSDPWGAFITVTLRAVAPNDTAQVRGEFLAVDRDTVFVLPADSMVRRIPTHLIVAARVAWYDSDWEKLAIWAGIGTLSTASHGFFLIFTSPIWGLTAWATAPAESRAPLVDVGRAGWAAAKQYARYPAGVPDSLPERLPTKPVYPRSEASKDIAKP